MVNFTTDEIHKIMNRRNNIRNISVIAHVDHDRSTIINSLVAAAGIIAQEVGDVRMTDTSADEVKHGTTIESTDIYLYHEVSEKSLRCYKGERDGNGFLINLSDSHRHIEVPPEVMGTLCLTDGALVIMDGIEGVHVQTETMLREAVVEKIKPVLCLNNVDRCLLELQFDGERTYQILSYVIENANAIMEACKDRLCSGVQVHPGKGTVAFSAGSQGWAFTLTKFAEFYASKFCFNASEMAEKLWGENFFDPSTKKWTTKDTGTPTCKRGFVQFCYSPIKIIMRMCLNDQKDKLWPILQRLGVTIKAGDKELMGKALMERVMQAWLPGSTALLDMMVLQLPSPVRAQKYRVDNLYKGPLDDIYATAIRSCDPRGPLMLYVSKMIPASDKGRFFASGRVFSGRVARDMTVRIVGSNYVAGQEMDLQVKTVLCTVIWTGKKQQFVKDVPCGNIALVGLDVDIGTNIMLTNVEEADACPISAIKFSKSPVACVDALDRATDQDPDSTDALHGFFTMKAAGRRKGRDFHLSNSVYKNLYSYQKEAIEWFWSVHCNQTGAILADDMGLGKTREVSAFLLGLFESGIIKRAMIIVPVTLSDQWFEELKEVGMANILRFTGARDEADKVALNTVTKKGGLFLTTMETFRNHHTSILGQGRKHWDYIFVDEGHRIKNQSTQIFECLNAVQSDHKIVVSGTPIQNNLKEFHALMKFCCPHLLGDYSSFNKQYILPIDRGKHRDATAKMKKESVQAFDSLKELIKPYVLRRTKELLKDAGRLGNKYELTVWLSLTQEQENLTAKLLDGGFLKFLDDERGWPLAVATIAQEICNFPLLSITPREESGQKVGLVDKIRKKLSDQTPVNDLHVNNYNASCKLTFVLYLVPHLLAEGHKILIFSQSPKMLELLQLALGSILEEKKIIRMDGGTRKAIRKKIINEFQPAEDKKPPSESGDEDTKSPSESRDGPSVFLLSTLVGGVGLNLTNASRVIIIDPSKNPSADNQCVDRAFRAGQTKDVVAYRLVTCGTVEEHHYRMQVVKQEISNSVLGEQCKRALNKKDGKVLTLPEESSEGFRTSRTHGELVSIYGNKFPEGLESHIRFVKKQEFVIDIFNHSLLFSMKEDVPLAHEEISPPKAFRPHQYKRSSSDTVTNGELFAFPPNLKDKNNVPMLQRCWPMHNQELLKEQELKVEQKGLKAKGATRQKSRSHNAVSTSSLASEISVKIKVAKEIIPHLLGVNQKKIEEMRRISGAIIGLAPAPAFAEDYEIVMAIGSADAVKKAERLITDFVELQQRKDFQKKTSRQISEFKKR